MIKYNLYSKIHLNLNYLFNDFIILYYLLPGYLRHALAARPSGGGGWQWWAASRDRIIKCPKIDYVRKILCVQIVYIIYIKIEKILKLFFRHLNVEYIVSSTKKVNIFLPLDRYCFIKYQYILHIFTILWGLEVGFLTILSWVFRYHYYFFFFFMKSNPRRGVPVRCSLYRSRKILTLPKRRETWSSERVEA